MRVHKVVSSRDKTLGAISMLVNGGGGDYCSIY